MPDYILVFLCGFKVKVVPHPIGDLLVSVWGSEATRADFESLSRDTGIDLFGAVVFISLFIYLAQPWLS